MKAPFQFLKYLDNECILFAIMDEHPQTIAVIVSCLQPAKAAYILERLVPERQLAVISRVASMRQIEVAVIELVEKELMAQISDRKYIRLGGIDNVADALTDIDPGTSQNILENLEQDDPDFVKELKQAMDVIRIIRQRERDKGIL